MTADEAMVRAAHICKIKGIKLASGELLEMATLLKEDPDADAMLVRATNICRIKGVAMMTGTELLKLANFLIQD